MPVFTHLLAADEQTWAPGLPRWGVLCKACMWIDGLLHEPLLAVWHLVCLIILLCLPMVQMLGLQELRAQAE